MRKLALVWDLLIWLSPLALLAACGGRGGGEVNVPGDPASVSGVILAYEDVALRDPDAVGTPPREWLGEDGADAGGGTAALAHADWTLAGENRSGVTAGDGTFAIAGLAPGRYELEVTRTLAGDLVATSLAFGVGDDGGATVRAEVAWGRSRASSTYLRDGRELEEIFVPSRAHVVLADGKIVELGDGIRVWEDVDADGDFDTCTVVHEAATCVVAQIGAILTQQPERLRVGQTAGAQAVLTLSDGSALDVTDVVEWRTSDPGVAIVDAFGRITARGTGSAEIQARLGDLGSLLTTLEVVERGALVRLQVQNASCYYPYGIGEDAEPLRPGTLPEPSDQGIWAPTCRQVVEIGGSMSFFAIGELEGGDIQDLTSEVVWSVEPAEIGAVNDGLFTADAIGTGTIVARLDGVASAPTEVRVVSEPSLVAISIYAEDGGIGLPVPVDGGGVTDPSSPASDVAPCPGCGAFQLTVLRGDDVPLRANGEYDTGIWRDLTGEVAWASTVATVATVASDGSLTAHAAGDTAVTASAGGVTSAPAQIRVVADATLQHLWIFQPDERVVARGDQRFFTATGSYDVGFSRDVTGEVEWRSSDPAVATVDAAGVLTGVGAGDVEVWAEADGVASDRVRLEVFETSELAYCDPANVNRGTWTDGFNRVLLESDCATYAHPDVAALRFTVTEKTSPGGIFDPCLDLYVFQGDTRVRTIREEGCGDPFLPRDAAGLEDEILKYQVRAFWDLKDDRGEPVPAGQYQIHGRFYLYYDPVVSLTVTIQ